MNSAGFGNVGESNSQPNSGREGGMSGRDGANQLREAKKKWVPSLINT